MRGCLGVPASSFSEMGMLRGKGLAVVVAGGGGVTGPILVSIVPTSVTLSK